MADGTESAQSPGTEEVTTVYDRIGDAVVAVDEAWLITHANEEAERLLERSASALVGSHLCEAFPETVWTAFERECDRVMETQSTVTFEVRFPSLDAWYEVRAHPSETGLTVLLRDVTERVARERRVEKRERALRDAYEVISAPDEPFSEQIQALLAVVRETIGTDYATLSRVDENTGEYVFEAVDVPDDADLEAGDTTSLQATNCERVVGTERTVVLQDVEADAPELADRAGNAEWGISCYLGAPVVVDDEMYGTFCFYDMEAKADAFTDWEVTFVELLGRWVGSMLERERREQELEASNERLEEFAYAASHDLQEPLRMVTSYLELLESRAGDEFDEEAEEFVAYAVDGAERMREMIDGLLEYARVETRGDPFEPVDLEAVLEDVRADLRFRVEELDAEVTASTLPTVSGDPTQLRQLLQNLLENALEYSGDEPPRIHVGAERRGDEWEISVADEGVGIDADDADRVFEVFQRLHSHEEHAGTGLGLALCERIVERHDGDIWVGEESSEGAVIRFTLSASVDE